MPAGSFTLWPYDEDNKPIKLPNPIPPPPAPQPVADPSDPKAVEIYFGVPLGAPKPAPKEQLDLQEKIQKVLRAIQILYPQSTASTAKQQKQFRNYYIRLFGVGQLGLEGTDVSTDIANAALDSTIADLIDDEAGHVKEKHLVLLGGNALVAGVVCLALYFALCLIAAYVPTASTFLLTLNINARLLANFMLLLTGSFVGVWLSYAIRTTTFTLSDLTVTDSDRLTPAIRLIYAGWLTIVLGIVFALPLVEFKVGNFPVTDVAGYPMLAFVVGCFCGISELTLPTAVAKRASDFIQNIK